MEPKDRQTPPDARAQHRAYVLEHVVDGGLTIDQAAHILKLSTRQVARLLVRYRDGPVLLAHGNRGRAPTNRLADDRRARLVELATTTYAGVNHTHLAELLAEREGVEVAQRTLRRILAEANVRPVRTRRPPRHRSRRERMAREGQLLQVDGSRHRWFGPDVGFATLVAGIDDATGRVPGGCPTRRRIDLSSTSACPLRLHRPSGGSPGRPPTTLGGGVTLDAAGDSA